MSPNPTLRTCGDPDCHLCEDAASAPLYHITFTQDGSIHHVALTVDGEDSPAVETSAPTPVAAVALALRALNYEADRAVELARMMVSRLDFDDDGGKPTGRLWPVVALAAGVVALALSAWWVISK